MRRLLAIVGLVLLACGPSHTATVMSPSPSVTAPATSMMPPPTMSPSPGTGPSAFPDLPVSKVELSCRLPVVTSPVEGSAGVTLNGGFGRSEIGDLRTPYRRHLERSSSLLDSAAGDSKTDNVAPTPVASQLLELRLQRGHDAEGGRFLRGSGCIRPHPVRGRSCSP